MGVQEFKVDLRRAAKPGRRQRGSPRAARRKGGPSSSSSSFPALRESCEKPPFRRPEFPFVPVLPPAAVAAAVERPPAVPVAADWESWVRYARQTKCKLADGMITDYVAADRGVIIGVIVSDHDLLDRLTEAETDACDASRNVAKSLTAVYQE